MTALPATEWLARDGFINLHRTRSESQPARVYSLERRLRMRKTEDLEFSAYADEAQEWARLSQAAAPAFD